MYINFNEYNTRYPSELTELTFPSIEGKAERLIDDITTGIDGIRKLEEYFPTSERDVNSVKNALIECVHESVMFDNFSKEKEITSISSGSETIHYATQSNIYSLQGTQRTDYLRKRLTDALRNVYDSRGVKLLYLGDSTYVR